MTTETLECGHCGGVAIESADGLFGEDDADACASCGMPGHVSIDEDTGASWTHHDEDDDVYCNKTDCWDCDEQRKKFAKAAHP